METIKKLMIQNHDDIHKNTDDDDILTQFIYGYDEVCLPCETTIDGDIKYQHIFKVESDGIISYFKLITDKYHILDDDLDSLCDLYQITEVYSQDGIFVDCPNHSGEIYDFQYATNIEVSFENDEKIKYYYGIGFDHDGSDDLLESLSDLAFMISESFLKGDDIYNKSPIHKNVTKHRDAYGLRFVYGYHNNMDMWIAEHPTSGKIFITNFRQHQSKQQ